MTKNSKTTNLTPSTDTNKLKALVYNPAGQNQNNRGLIQLSARYFVMQERSFSGWIDYMRQFAQKMVFFDESSGATNLRWHDALPDQQQALQLEAFLFDKKVLEKTVPEDILALAARPDIASLMAFYTMMQYPFEKMNRFTQWHQEHYYYEVLGFTPISPIADKSHLVLSLSDSTSTLTLLKGTQFSGGEDKDGNALIYQVNNNALLNHVQVNKALTLSRHKSSGNLLLTRCIDTDRGIEMPESGALTFGELNSKLPDVQQSPKVGFTLASPELFLSGGKRTLTLTFNLNQTFEQTEIDFREYFDISISTTDKMITLDQTTPFSQIEVSNTDNAVVLTLVLEPLFPAITVLIIEEANDEVQATTPTVPFISFTLKTDEYDDNYGENSESFSRILRKSLVSQIKLDIDVKDLPGIIASHDGSVLDTSAPFQPFGYGPRIRSKLDFTHPELLIKHIQQASVEFEWLDLPASLVEHYKPYMMYRENNNDNPSGWPDNMVNIYHSDLPKEVGESKKLFSNPPDDNIAEHSLTFISEAQRNDHDFNALPQDEANTSSWPKRFSLVLTNNDFGHSEYGQVVQYISHLNMALFNQDPPGQPIQVNVPYTPMLNAMRLNYRSQTEFSFSTMNTRHQLQYIHPLGRPAIDDKQGGFALLPDIKALGYLYLALADVSTPGQFRLYFQLDPVDGSNIVNNPQVDWQYWSQGQWNYFNSSQEGSARIVEDSTYKLLDSGVVTFELPQLETQESRNNFTGDQHFWVRILIDSNAISGGEHAKYSRLRAIYAQGVEVELISGEYHPSHFEQPLPADSIKEFVQSNDNIESILQPYASYGGKPTETPEKMIIRASERLRHKNRAINAWDYERLVLGEFPELFFTRCFRPDVSSNVSTNDTATEERVDVAMVVVPINHDPDILQPKVPLYLKRKIQRYLSSVSPYGVITKIVDPVYDEIQIELYAKISADYDIERIESLLNQQIIDHLTPWNNSNESGGGLANDIYLTELATVLEHQTALEQVYVIRAFRGTKLCGDIITPENAQGILVPAREHRITLFSRDTPIFEGIEKWRLELDFIIS